MIPTQQSRQAAAQTRVVVALACIEEAQCLLDLAAQALCSVTGMEREWDRLVDLHNETKATWHVVRGRASVLASGGGPLLDHEPTASETEWQARLRGGKS